MPITPYKEQRPWGSFERFVLNEQSTVKLITVKAGEAFSLQSHEKRDEFWKIISGDGTITLGDKVEPIEAGGEYSVPRAMTHRVEAGANDVVFLEVSTGDFDENDITRLVDRYGRV